MPKPNLGKSKKNVSQIDQTYPPNPIQSNYYYPPESYGADQYQPMPMDQMQAAQYQMGYYPTEMYPPQGYQMNSMMILDEGQRLKESPKSAKKESKSKFALFKSHKSTTDSDKSTRINSSTVPVLPPVDSKRTQVSQTSNPPELDQNQISHMTNDRSNSDSNNNIESIQSANNSGDLDGDDSISVYGNSGNVQVLIRVRPPNPLELKTGYIEAISCANDGETLFVTGPDGRGRPLTFSKVYDQQASQEEFFNKSGIKDLIRQALDGYSICIFAFGQTGSGKSFTITGPEKNMTQTSSGIVPRALRYLFDEIIGRESTVPVVLRSSYLEIYNEHVYDLLNPKGSSLQIRWSAEKGFFVENLYVIDCDVLDDCLAILEEGLNNRTTASHRLNEHSSRSHSVMTLHLDSEFTDPSDGRVIQRHGKLCFVDLAGSERVKESQAQGDTLTETLNINKSLLTLGKCIAALSDPRKRAGHIPFRDSKLTKLLADSLGGHGLALMIACVSPALQNITETVKTLRYAQSAKKIKIKPVVNLDPREEMLYMLKREIQSLKRENELLKDAVMADPRYQDLLDFISQGKHLKDMAKISRSPQGKTNIQYKIQKKEITENTRNEYKGYEKSFSTSAGLNRNTGNLSALDKYRKQQKFTPGLGEPSAAVNTWRNARSISRSNSRGRRETRDSINSRSESASTRASVASRASIVSRSSVSSFASIQPKKPSMKRELSGRFDTKVYPRLNLKNKTDSISGHSKSEKISKKSLPISKVDYNNESEMDEDKLYGNNSEFFENDQIPIPEKEEPKKTSLPEHPLSDDENPKSKKKDSKIKSQKEKSIQDNASNPPKKVNIKSDEDEDHIKTKGSSTTNGNDNKGIVEPLKKPRKRPESLIKKDSQIIVNDKDSSDHAHLPNLVKLKKKTMKDVEKLDEEIRKMT